MKLPRYTATTPPPRTSGTVPAQNIGALTQSSEQAKWSGVGAFGRGLNFAGQLAFKAHLNRQALDDSIEWGTATSRVKDRFRLASETAERMDVSMDMPAPDDPNYLKTLASFSTVKRDQFLTEALKDIEKDVSKLSQGFSNPKNKADFENWYNANYDNLANNVRSMYAKKLDSYQRSEISRLSETAAENGDVKTADRFVELMDKYELITPERAEALKKNNKIIADTSITYRNARTIMAVKGYQEAIDYVMAQNIDRAIKEKVVGDIKFNAAQQKLSYDKYVEKIEQDFLIKLRQEKLTEDEVMVSLLEVNKKQEWLVDIDAQVKERLEGEKELNWDTYDKLQAMVEGYDKDIVSKDEVRKEISKAVKSRDITTTIAMRLRDRLATKDNPDDPMNRSDVKRGLGVLTDLESFEIEQAKKDKADLEEIREIRLAYQKKMDEFERWVKGQEKLTDTDIQNKIGQMTQLEVEEKAKGFLDNVFGFYKGYYKYISGYKAYELWKERGEKGELPEPATLADFEDTVRLLGEEDAKAYYEKWKNKW